MIDNDLLTVFGELFLFGVGGGLSLGLTIWLISWFISQLIHFFKALSK